VADVLGLVQLASLLTADANQYRQRFQAAARVGLSTARHGLGRIDAGCRQRCHVRHVWSDDGGGAGAEERQAAVGMDASNRAKRAESRIPASQSRRGRARQHGLRRDTRRLSLRPRRTCRHRALVGARRRKYGWTLDHRCTARRRRQSRRRHQRRRSRHPRLSRRVRREDRQTGVAVLHHPVTRRARQRGLARRQLGSRRRSDLADRILRSRAEAALLGHRESGSGLERRLAQRRQPLHLVSGGDRHRHGQAALAFPVHSARRPRLGRESDPRARRHAGRRPRAAAGRHRQPQRFLLRARSKNRRVRVRHSLRQTDVG